MAYFSNGTEGDMYEFRWCSKCVHSGKDGTACAVMLVHILHSYELCNKEQDPGKQILDTLIPMQNNAPFPAKCSMFITREQVTRKRAEHKTQLRLPEPEFIPPPGEFSGCRCPDCPEKQTPKRECFCCADRRAEERAGEVEPII